MSNAFSFSLSLSRELYELFKLDHDLFGYSPDEYIAMGREEGPVKM